MLYNGDRSVNFSLFPIPASEELAMGYVPSVGSCDSHTSGEPISFRMVSAVYLLMLLVIFRFPSDAPAPDAQSGAAETRTLAEASCEDCDQAPLLPAETKD